MWNWIEGHWLLLAAILLAPFAPVIAAGYLLYKLVGIVAHVFDEIKNVITGGFDSWWAGHGKELEQVWNAAWSAIKDTFDILFGPIVAAVKAGLEPDRRRGAARIDLLEDLFRMGWGYVAATTRATWDLISGIFKAAWDVISGVVQIAVSGVESVVKIAWDLLVGIFDVALDLLTGHWSKAWTDIQNTVTQVWNAIKSFLGSAISDIESMFAGAWNALLGGVKSWASDLIGYVKQIPGMILAALGDVGHMLWNAGVSIIQGLIGGIKSAIGGIAHASAASRRPLSAFCRSPQPSKGPCPVRVTRTTPACRSARSSPPASPRRYLA